MPPLFIPEITMTPEFILGIKNHDSGIHSNDNHDSGIHSGEKEKKKKKNMPHSYNRIWIHAICGTKNRAKIIDDKLEPILYEFLRKQLTELGCPVRIINGMPEHIHCLFLLNPQKSITEIIKQIKGSSSRYINKNEFLPHKFEWQIGYSAFSVSSQACDIVYKYISNQKEHHKKQTFPDEYLEFLTSNQLDP